MERGEGRAKRETPRYGNMQLNMCRDNRKGKHINIRLPNGIMWNKLRLNFLSKIRVITEKLSKNSEESDHE